MQYTDEELIDELQRVAEELDKVPTCSEMNESDGPCALTYRDRFGSWDQALETAGFDTWGYSEEELIKELQRVAEELGKVPCQREMRESDGPSVPTYKSHFGSWNNSLRLAGFEPNEEKTNYSDEELIEELQRVAEELGKVPTAEEMKKSDGPCYNTYSIRFGSWNQALRLAGFEPHQVNPSNYTDEELIEELQRVAEELGKVPTEQEMNESDGPSKITYQVRFGSWNQALRLASFEPHHECPNYTDEELIEELHRVAEELGHVPTLNEMRTHARISTSPFFNQFGSWNNFILDSGYEPNPRGAQPGKDNHSYKGGFYDNYGPNWEGANGQAEKARQRDDYTCQAIGCEVTQDDLDASIPVHHITRKDDFRDEDGNLDYEEANRLENLVALCPSCHPKLEGKYASLTAAEFKEAIQAEV